MIEYYHRLFKLWQRAKISIEDKIETFKNILKSNIIVFKMIAGLDFEQNLNPKTCLKIKLNNQSCFKIESKFNFVFDVQS